MFGLTINILSFHSFRDNQLEQAYQRYSHRQRQKSLIIVNAVDFVLKLLLVSIFLINETEPKNDNHIIERKVRILYFLVYLFSNVV